MTENATSDRPAPQVTDRATWQARLDELRVNEKAHTRAGDALAAQRRRLPMVEVDATTKLIGPDGPVPLIDVFDGRTQLIAYYLMWHTGKPAAGQCEGCTFNTAHLHELSYLHSRGVSYATFCQGPYEESARYRDFMGWTFPWYSVPEDAVDRLVADPHAGFFVCYLRDGDKVYETYRTAARGNEPMTPSYGLLDLTVYGPPGVLGGLAGGLAAELERRRWPVHAGGPPDRPMAKDQGRARRRSRRRERRVIGFAHMGGMPLEELLPLAPVIWVAIGARLATRRKGQR
jgi:predicted dithiol-disulfide oxidoreductase (DUF899 family)